MKSCFRVVAMLVLMLPGCGNDPGAPRTESEPWVELPAPIGEAQFGDESVAVFYPSVQWSSDGRLVHYLSRVHQQSGVMELNLETRHTRALATGATSYQILRATADGEYLFFSAAPAGPSHNIYRMPTAGGDPEPLVLNASHLFAISPDGRFLSWRTYDSDSLLVRNLATGETYHLGRFGIPVLIADDGSAVALVGATVESRSVATGALMTSFDGVVKELRWSGTQFEALAVVPPFQVVMWAGAAHTPALLTTTNGYVPNALTWSPDGSRVAMALQSACIVAPCRYRVVLLDIGTGVLTALADADFLLSKPRFSPDGRRVVVTGNDRLFVIDVP